MLLSIQTMNYNKSPLSFRYADKSFFVKIIKYITSTVDAGWSGCYYCSNKMVQGVSWRFVLRAGYCDRRPSNDIPSSTQRSLSDSGSICLRRLGTSKNIHRLILMIH